MRQGWIGSDRCRRSIILNIFGWVSLGVGKLRNFELVGVGEYHHWSDSGDDLSHSYLVHNF